MLHIVNENRHHAQGRHTVLCRKTKHRSAREDVRQLNKASYEGSGEQKNDLCGSKGMAGS